MWLHVSTFEYLWLLGAETCLVYIRTQYVPRSKHSPPRLYKTSLFMSLLVLRSAHNTHWQWSDVWKFWVLNPGVRIVSAILLIYLYLSHPSIYLSIYISGFFNSCRLLPKPNAIPLCFSIHLVLNFLLLWLLVHLPSTFFFGRPLFLFSRGIHSIINFGILSFGILLTWPYHCSLLFSMMCMCVCVCVCVSNIA